MPHLIRCALALALVAVPALALADEAPRPTKLTALNLKQTADSEGNARFSLAAPVAGSLALKVSYDVQYRNQPLAGLQKLDTTFGVGVQATF